MASYSAAPREPDTCAICLQPVEQEAFLDRCFHAFCYKCVLQWSRVVSKKQSCLTVKCPLCKAESASIIHDYNEGFFLQHHLNRPQQDCFMTSAHQARLHHYTFRNNGNAIFDSQQYWRRRSYLKKNIWVSSWLTREIQTLCQEEDVDVIVHHIQGMMESFRREDKGGKNVAPEQKREEFRALVSEAAGPFLLDRTPRFVHELEQFLASGLNIQAYDKVCMRQRLDITTANTIRENEEEQSAVCLSNEPLHAEPEQALPTCQ